MIRALIIALSAALASPAAAQTLACMSHARIVTLLSEGWGEVVVAVALGADGTVFETFANLDTGTWTIVVTAPGGPTCPAAAGSDFHLMTMPAGEES